MNARQEYIRHTAGRNVRCAKIEFKDCFDNVEVCLLPVGWDYDDFKIFLEEINRSYDNSCQELYGTIWYVDGTWSTRQEYGYAEWWEYHSCPVIPDELK